MKLIVKGLLRSLIPTAVFLITAFYILFANKNELLAIKLFYITGIVFLVFFFSIIKDISNLKHMTKSILHFIVSTITIFPLLLLSHILTFTDFVGFMKAFLIYLLWYTLIWFISYFILSQLLDKHQK